MLVVRTRSPHYAWLQYLRGCWLLVVNYPNQVKYSFCRADGRPTKFAFLILVPLQETLEFSPDRLLCFVFASIGFASAGTLSRGPILCPICAMPLECC